MREFGRAPGCICNVLAVLGDGEESIRATFSAAVDLADAGNARLTLVKTCEEGRAYVWIAPFAVGAAYMPPALDSPDDAARLLARVTEEVPDRMPVTTLVLTADTQGSLLRLLRDGRFGAVVADADLLSRCRRLRRYLCGEQIQTVLIRSGCAPAESDQLASASLTTRSAEVSTSASAASNLSRLTGSSSYLRRVRPKPAR